MKKLMLLGGSRYIIPVIEAAHQLGCYVITCDYLPNNDAHKYSDQYINESIIDKEKILTIAEREKIDGIMSFACDPGVVTAAYVAERLGLPYAANYETICLLQNKDKFREFLRKNGFNAPKSVSFGTMEEVRKFAIQFEGTAIVKPIDSAGSKGVSKVDDKEQLLVAAQKAFSNSISNRIIIEEFLEAKGDPSDCDCFSVDGEMVFTSFSGQKFDQKASNPFTPAGFMLPCEWKESDMLEIQQQLQKLCSLLSLGTSLYNVESRIGIDGKAYLMEVSPRGGGNRLSEIVKLTTGVDLIGNAIKAALGMELDADITSALGNNQSLVERKFNGGLYEHILHADEEGEFEEVFISSDLLEYLHEKDIWVNKGDSVGSFTGANKSIGTLIFVFPSKEEMKKYTQKINEKIKVGIRHERG